MFSKNSSILWDNYRLILLDQRLLPEQEKYLEYSDGGSVAGAISQMVVRGAPAIGVTAAYGIVLAAKNLQDKKVPINFENLKEAFENLASSRPTAVNLFFALDKMKEALGLSQNKPDCLEQLEKAALKIHKEDAYFCEAMGKFGSSLIEKNSLVYTHCNAGSLATGGMGTAVGVITTAHGENKIEKVFVDETRPWMQGSRLTCWELQKASVPHQLCIEGAAAFNMSRYPIKWVIVGADRIAANGDAANKIGTYNLAAVAKYHDVKLMVVAPSSTIDFNIQSGAEIPIEYRADLEITEYKGLPIAPKNTGAPNPVFDVTPAGLIDCLVCEKGIIHNPSREKMRDWQTV